MNKVYQVLSRLRHDGIIYEAGAILRDIEEQAAKLLIESGVIKLVEEVDKAIEEEATKSTAPAAPQTPETTPTQAAPSQSQSELPPAETPTAPAAPQN